MISSSTLERRRGLWFFVLGVIAVTAGVLLHIPPLALVSLIIMVPTIAAMVLMVVFGEETRGRDLRDLDPEGDVFAATGP